MKISTKSEINPCKYHPESGDITVEGNPYGYRYFVVCRTCGATGPYSKNAQEAIERWNYGNPKKNA
jgi:hypothetical protein